MKRIQEDFKLKDDKIEPPDVFPGATLAKIKFDSGKYCWTMSTEQYVKAAVTNVEEDLARSGKRFSVEMHHAALEQLFTLVGGFSGAGGGPRVTIPGSHQPAKVGPRDRTPGNPVGDISVTKLPCDTPGQAP